MPDPLPADVAKVQSFLRLVVLLGRPLANSSATTFDNALIDDVEFIADHPDLIVFALKVIAQVRGGVSVGEALAGAAA